MNSFQNYRYSNVDSYQVSQSTICSNQTNSIYFCLLLFKHFFHVLLFYYISVALGLLDIDLVERMNSCFMNRFLVLFLFCLGLLLVLLRKLLCLFCFCLFSCLVCGCYGLWFCLTLIKENIFVIQVLVLVSDLLNQNLNSWVMVLCFRLL